MLTLRSPFLAGKYGLQKAEMAEESEENAEGDAGEAGGHHDVGHRQIRVAADLAGHIEGGHRRRRTEETDDHPQLVAGEAQQNGQGRRDTGDQQELDEDPLPWLQFLPVM